MKNETAGVVIDEFFGLKPEMYLYLVDDNSEHKKTNVVNKIFIQNNEYDGLSLGY